MAEADWRTDLAFSERFSHVSKIRLALRRADGGDNTQAQSLAREIEKDAFDHAISKTDYLERCVVAAAEHNENPTSHPSHDFYRDVALSPAAITLGKYEGAHHYQDGIFSQVYKARNCRQDRPAFVALKVTVPSMMVAPHDSRREARLLRNSSCDHVIPLLETFQLAGDRFVLVFEFMPLDLDYLLKSGRAEQTQVRSHLRDLFAALEFVHAKGLIHRDVKPSNILLKSPAGPAFLADFGTAWSPTDKSSEPANEKITDIGTTCYRPPEILFGDKNYDSSLDMWAAGCVVAEAAGLSDRSLFDAGDLGSELALIQSIFKSLGTPDLTVWPGASKLPDWGKMLFKEYPTTPWEKLLPDLPTDALDLVRSLVLYQADDRLSAKKSLEYSYLKLGR